MDPEHLETNRRAWDEMTAVHVKSAFYNVEGFLAGESSLCPFEPEELGDVSGCSLLHLQCHFGLDSLSWARRGAKVTGLDFSAPAIAEAKRLAERSGIEADFVQADVYDAAVVLDERFDIIYTGLGALNWLGDLSAWAATIASLLKPGGRFYLVEFHPLLWVLSDDELTLDGRWSYFRDPAGISFDDHEDYADPDVVLEHSATHEWAHDLGEVLSVLLDAGLEIKMFHEHDQIAFRRFSQLEEVEGDSRRFRIPKGLPQLPLQYSLLAVAPATG